MDITRLLIIWGILIIYLLLLARLVWRVYAKDEVSDVDTWKCGTHDYPWPILLLTLTATFVGPGYTLGYIDEIVSSGGFAIVLFLLTTSHLFVLGWWLNKRPNLHERLSQHTSFGDFVEYSYGPYARILSGLLVGLITIAFAGLLCFAGVETLEAIYGIEPTYSALMIAVVIAIYSISLGFPGVLATEKAQLAFVGMLALILIGVSISWFLFEPAGDIRPAWSFVPEEGKTHSSMALAGMALTFLLGEAFQPYWLNRMFISRSARDSSIAFRGSAIAGIVWFLLLGTYALVLVNTPAMANVEAGALFESIRMLFSNELLRAVVLGVLGATILGIVMSTLDSIVNAGVVSFTDDFYTPLVGVSDRAKLKVARLHTFIILVGGALVATQAMSIVQILFVVYSYWIPMVVPQLCVAFFGNYRYVGEKWTFVFAAGAGLAGMIVLSNLNYVIKLMGVDFRVPSELVPTVGGLMLNCLVLYLAARRQS